MFHHKMAHLYFHKIHDTHFREHMHHHDFLKVFRKYEHITDDVFKLVGCPLGVYDEFMDLNGFSQLITQCKLIDSLLTIRLITSANKSATLITRYHCVG